MRGWRFALIAGALALVGAVPLSTGTAAASVPVAGEATVNYAAASAPPLGFGLTGPMPLPQPSVGELSVGCGGVGPTTPCLWQAQNYFNRPPLGSGTVILGSGTCVIDTATPVGSPSQLVGTWTLSCSGLSQGVATSFNLTVVAAISDYSTTMTDGGNTYISYTGAYQAS
jgi:hypothetical protein